MDMKFYKDTIYKFNDGLKGCIELYRQSHVLASVIMISVLILIVIGAAVTVYYNTKSSKKIYIPVITTISCLIFLCAMSWFSVNTIMPYNSSLLMAESNETRVVAGVVTDKFIDKGFVDRLYLIEIDNDKNVFYAVAETDYKQMNIGDNGVVVYTRENVMKYDEKKRTAYCGNIEPGVYYDKLIEDCAGSK